MSTPTTSIQQSWQDNAKEWIYLIREQKIASRQVTNPAIVQTLLDYQLSSLIDIGCGEGWLTRAMYQNGVSVTGVDGTAALIEHARANSPISFHRLTYEAICAGAALPVRSCEAAVFNFCLYQERETATLLKAVHRQLNGKKLLFIQTIHPKAFEDTGIPYKSQWMEDSWKGLDGDFSSTHQWYFRTHEDWLALFDACDLNLTATKEPMNHRTGKPASIIFVLS